MVHNNSILLNPWHTVLPTAQQTTEADNTWIYIYNRHTYLPHTITARPQNSLEYHIRAHLRHWQAR
eukprot:7248122-Prorocentrum_lima.AAC.1